MICIPELLIFTCVQSSYGKIQVTHLRNKPAFHCLVKNKLNIVRINPCITLVSENGIYRAPVLYREKEDEFLALMDLDMDTVEQPEIDMISAYVKTFIAMDEPPIANQFIRGDAEGDHLGYGSYSDAKARWMEIREEESVPGTQV